MLAKAFGVNPSFIWRALTLLIRAFLSDKVRFCPNCGSKNVVKDGHNRRLNIPNVKMFQCKACERKFTERANTIFYWKHSSAGELFVITWIFYGVGSRRWPKEWISSIGESSLTAWFERVENAMRRVAGATPSFTDGIFQADEMMIRSFGERLWIMGVRRSDGRICLNVLMGDSGLEFKSSLRRAEEELGPIVDLDSDGHKSYPWATRQLGIIHRPVNRKEEGFVNEAGVHLNGVENQWSMDRDWVERARGYNSIESLGRAVKGRQVYHNQVKNSPVPVWAFLKIAICDSNRGYFFIYFPSHVFTRSAGLSTERT